MPCRVQRKKWYEARKKKFIPAKYTNNMKFTISPQQIPEGSSNITNFNIKGFSLSSCSFPFLRSHTFYLIFKENIQWQVTEPPRQQAFDCCCLIQTMNFSEWKAIHWRQQLLSVSLAKKGCFPGVGALIRMFNPLFYLGKEIFKRCWTMLITSQLCI